MPTTADAFLQAILESPEDDGPRLVYADWLDDRGHPGDSARAEFIRLQIEHARLDADDDRRDDLRLREEAILQEHGAAWREGLPEWTRQETCWFRRGFIAAVSSEAVCFVQQGPDLRRMVPLEGVRLRKLAHYSLIPSSPVFGGLRLLDVRNDDDDELLSRSDIWGISHSPQMKGLEVLSLTFQEWLGDPGMRVLVDGSDLGPLRELYLACCRVPAAGVEALASSRHREHLTTLDLYGNRIGARGASLLRGFPNLEALSVSHLGAGVSLLMASPHLRSLRSLWLELTSHALSSMSALASCPYLDGLRALELSSNKLTDRSVQMLAGSPHLVSLTHLNLFDNAITDEGAEALASAPHLSRLRALKLSANRISDAGASALASSAHLKDLRKLDLSQNQIGPTGAAVLRERFGDNVRCYARLEDWRPEMGVLIRENRHTREQDRWGVESAPLSKRET